MSEQQTPPIEVRLESWKAIAVHLNRDVRTVMRWERSEGLPVHRHRHLARSTVYAFPSELDAWRANRKPESARTAAPPILTRSSRIMVAACASILALATAGSGRLDGFGLTAVQSGPSDHVAREAQLKPTAADPFASVPPNTRFSMGWSPSPDGTLALENDNNGAVLHRLASGRGTVLLENEGAGGPRVQSDFVWSPDGRQAVYHFGNGNRGRGAGTAGVTNELRIVDVTTGAVRTLVTAPVGHVGTLIPRAWTKKNEIVYSPWVAPVASQPPSTPMYIVPVSGGQARVAFELDFRTGRQSGWGRDRVGNTTPDGSAIAVINAEHLALIDLVTGAERVLSGGIGAAYPQLSPDGRLIAYLARRDGAWGVFVATVGETAMGVPVRVAPLRHRDVVVPKNARLRWTGPDALSLDYSSEEANLHRIDTDPTSLRPTGSPVRISRNLDGVSPVISPDSKRILFAPPLQVVTLDLGILLIGADGSGERRVVDRPIATQDLPNYGWLSNDRIVYSRGDSPDLVVRNVDTGVEQSAPQFRGLNPADPESGGTRRLDLQFEILSSRNEIWYRYGEPAAGPPEWFLASASSIDGSRRAVLPIEAGMRGGAFEGTVSPDGARVAIWLRRPQNVQELRLINVASGEHRVLLQPRWGALSVLGWAPDSKHLLYSVPDGWPQVMNVDTGEARALFEKPIAANFEPGQNPDLSGWAWAPNGKFVVFTATTVETRRLAWTGITPAVVAKIR